MKIIKSKKEKQIFSFYFKNFIRDFLIIFSYTFGFVLYWFIFFILKWDYDLFKLYIIIIPTLGFVMGITHIVFIYKGSLFCKTITMITILLYVFILPIVITFVG